MRGWRLSERARKGWLRLRDGGALFQYTVKNELARGDLSISAVPKGEQRWSCTQRACRFRKLTWPSDTVGCLKDCSDLRVGIFGSWNDDARETISLVTQKQLIDMHLLDYAASVGSLGP